MKKFLPYLTLLFAIAGFVLLFFEDRLLMSMYLLFVLVPISLISSILQFKKELQEIDIGFRLSFVVISISIPLCVVLGILFRVQHYPGSALFFILSYLLCAIQFVLGLIYILQKRKTIQSSQIVVLVMLFLPFLITIWFRLPKPSEIANEKHNLALWEITKIMEEKNASKIGSLDSLSLKQYDYISEMKNNAIEWADGYDETGTVPICLNCRKIESFSNYIVLDSNQIDTRYVKLYNEAKTLGEINLLLTEIQTSLILENIK